MKNLILTMCLLLVVSLTYAQLHVTKNTVKPELNGAVGIGTSEPQEMLDVKGSAIVGSNPQKENESVNLFIGKGRTKKGWSGINLNPRGKSKVAVGTFASGYITKGDNAGKVVTTFSHNGSGDFSLRCYKPGSNIKFLTNDSGIDNKSSTTRLFIQQDGHIGIGTENPEALLDVAGSIAADNALKRGGEDVWTIISDKRSKKNINKYTDGLAEILRLNPVTYSYNGKAGISDTKSIHVGLLAQELVEIAPYAVEPYIHKETNEDGTNKTEEFLSMNATSLKYMLVNGMKEQQALIEAQKTALETLKTEVAELKANGASISTSGASEMSVLLEGSSTESALLAQNSPNPFTTTTRIEYFIPSNSRHCRMSFRDMNGKELKQVDITHDGIGAIELSSKDLAAGIYSYVLYVNGDIVASKKMILRQ